MLLVWVLGLGSAAALGCSRSSPPTGGGGDDGIVEVRLTAGLRFEPANLTIDPGTTVRWINTTSLFHTVTPDGHDEWARFPTSNVGETFEHTFAETGSFPYFCEPHRPVGMVGSVTVR